MSFKDVRDLSEHLKLLGYPKNLPLQTLYSNYGSLNSFIIVADILQWLTGRLEPGAILPGGTSSESQRVLLIRAATEFFVIKCAIKLNPRKLYGSSSAAAKELQKITNLLMMTPTNDDANTNGTNKNYDDDNENFNSLAMVDLGDKIEDLRRARELSSELTKRGAILYDLLSKELVNKEIRMNQSSRQMEIQSVEKIMKNAISSTQIKLQSAKSQLEAVRIEKNALNSKLQRKRAELDRSKQRLDALQKIRPAYLEEFEQLEEELKGLFQQYFSRIQCRDSLRAQLQARTKFTTPTSTPLSSKPAETSINFLPDGLLDDDDDDLDEDINDANEPLSAARNFDTDGETDGLARSEDRISTTSNATNINSVSGRVRPTTGRFKPRTGTVAGAGRKKIVGSMMGGDDDDNDSTLGSEESDSELELTGAHGYDLPSDDDISLTKLTENHLAMKKSAIKNSNENQSDEDF